MTSPERQSADKINSLLEDTSHFAGEDDQSTSVSFGGGTRLGKYTIVRPLGRGGMGTVFKALDATLERHTALKVTRRKPLERDVFDGEEAAAKLHHPHIVPIYESGEVGGYRYVSMKLLEGGSLHLWLNALRDKPQEVVQLFIKITEAISHAHGFGILHLDLKPGNILFDEEGEPYIADFGLARPWNPASGVTMTPALAGTPHYVAPEQIAGRVRDIGPSTDLYSLGSMLYEALVGRPPVEGGSAAEVLRAVAQSPIIPPRAINVNVPPKLEAICLKCLAKEPRDRYGSAALLLADLRNLLQDEEPTPPREPTTAPAVGDLIRSWRAALNSLSDGVIVADRLGSVIEANAAASRLLGQNVEAVRIHDWLGKQQCSGADDAPFEVEAFPLLRALRGETVTETDILLRTATRPYGVWLRMTAHPLCANKTVDGAVTVFRDVSSLKVLGVDAAEQDSLWDSLGLNVYRKDREGRYTFANNVFCTTVRKPRDEVMGRTDLDFFIPEVAEKHRHDDLLVIENGHGIEKIEEHRTSVCAAVCRCRSPGPVTARPYAADGPGLEIEDDLRYVQSLVAPVHNSLGQVVGTQGIFWNITAQRRAEQQFERLAVELQRSNHELARSNADLEQFAYAASHDLREPLRMICGFTELLQRRYQGKLDSDADDFIGFIVEGATRMHALIGDMLAYSQVNVRCAPEEVDCRALVDQAMANLQIALKESAAELTRGELPVLCGDRTQLVLLLQNLIGNAIKFRAPEPPRIHVGSRRQGSDWLFWVEDNGIGIDPKHAERIFGMFQVLHSRDKYSGTGIGLAICKRIVERHGGRIWVEPRLPGGSVFYFTLPTRRPAAPTAHLSGSRDESD